MVGTDLVFGSVSVGRRWVETSMVDRPGGQGQLGTDASGHRGPGLGTRQKLVEFGILQPLIGRLDLAW